MNTSDLIVHCKDFAELDRDLFAKATNINFV